MPFAFAESSTTGWITSQCSTTLPSSSRKKSASARPFSPGFSVRWAWVVTMSPSAMARLMSRVRSGFSARSECTKLMNASGPPPYPLAARDHPLLGNPAGVDEACESGAGGSGAVDLGAVLAGGGVEVELAAEDRRRSGAVACDAYVGVGCGAEFGVELAVLEGECDRFVVDVECDFDGVGVADMDVCEHRSCCGDEPA